MNPSIHGVSVPDSKLAHKITELVRDTESPLLFHHSSRVYYWGALAGKRRGLKFDAEGDSKITEALKASDKKDHLRVDVSGDVQGDTLKVTSIKLL